VKQPHQQAAGMPPFLSPTLTSCPSTADMTSGVKVVSVMMVKALGLAGLSPPAAIAQRTACQAQVPCRDAPHHWFSMARQDTITGGGRAACPAPAGGGGSGCMARACTRRTSPGRSTVTAVLRFMALSHTSSNWCNSCSRCGTTCCVPAAAGGSWTRGASCAARLSIQSNTPAQELHSGSVSNARPYSTTWRGLVTGGSAIMCGPTATCSMRNTHMCAVLSGMLC
jgi:hypothetical protein